MGLKNPNYSHHRCHLVPTLYDTDTVNNPGKTNTMNRSGEDYSDPVNQCFFLHVDMLHESPACIGIAHDPKVETAYGAVY